MKKILLFFIAITMAFVFNSCEKEYEQTESINLLKSASTGMPEGTIDYFINSVPYYYYGIDYCTKTLGPWTYDTQTNSKSVDGVSTSSTNIGALRIDLQTDKLDQASTANLNFMFYNWSYNVPIFPRLYNTTEQEMLALDVDYGTGNQWNYVSINILDKIDSAYVLGSFEDWDTEDAYVMEFLVQTGVTDLPYRTRLDVVEWEIVWSAPTLGGNFSPMLGPCQYMQYMMPYSTSFSMPSGKDDYEWQVTGGSITYGEDSYTMQCSLSSTSGTIKGRFKEDNCWSEWAEEPFQLNCY